MDDVRTGAAACSSPTGRRVAGRRVLGAGSRGRVQRHRIGGAQGARRGIVLLLVGLAGQGGGGCGRGCGDFAAVFEPDDGEDGQSGEEEGEGDASQNPEEGGELQRHWRLRI